MKRDIGSLFNDMVDVYEGELTHNSVMLAESGDNDLEIDDLENRLSDMIDKKLADVAKNMNERKENIKDVVKKTEQIETQQVKTETETETETE